MTSPDVIHPVLQDAVMRLNVIVALTMRPEMLDGILASLTPGQTELKFKDGSQVQIIESLTLAQPTSVKKFQYACVCRRERLVLVWHDDLQGIVPQATRMEEKLLALVSQHIHSFLQTNFMYSNVGNRSGERQDYRSTSTKHQTGLHQSFHLPCLLSTPLDHRSGRREGLWCT